MSAYYSWRHARTLHWVYGLGPVGMGMGYKPFILMRASSEMIRVTKGRATRKAALLVGHGPD